MTERYGPTQKLLHWLVVVLVLAQVGLGLWMTGAPPENKAWVMQLYSIHDGIGATVLVLMLLRILVRIVMGAPLLPRTTPAWVMTASELNHKAMYLMLIVQPLLGYFNNGAHGFGWSIYGLYEIPSLIPKNDLVAHWLSTAHLGGAGVLVALVALHLLGLFYHAAIRRDGVARRMA